MRGVWPLARVATYRGTTVVQFNIPRIGMFVTVTLAKAALLHYASCTCAT